MIDMVGLVNAGNEGLLVLAYTNFLKMQQANALKSNVDFKATFARDLKIHFVGAWDTILPAGVPENPWPVGSTVDHACIFRHALALDECRLRAVTLTPTPPNAAHKQPKDDAASDDTRINHDGGNTIEDTESKLQPRGPSDVQLTHNSKNVPNATEVWFPGKHVDIGGGLHSDALLSFVPLMWMESEAESAGLRLRPQDSTSIIREQFRQYGPKRHSSTPDLSDSTKRKPRGLSELRKIGLPNGMTRSISRGQRIHASVALMPKDYRPKAIFQNGLGIRWENLVGQDIEQGDFSWASRYGTLLEMNLFDRSSTLSTVRNLVALWSADEPSDKEPHWIGCLALMALSGNLSTVCLVSPDFIWDEDPAKELGCAVNFFQRLTDRQPTVFCGDLAETLETQGRYFHLRGRGDAEQLFEDALSIRRTSVGKFGRYKLAATLTWLASHSLAAQQPQKALLIFEESVEIVRSLIAEDYRLAFPLFADLQRSFASCLTTLTENDLSSALRVIQIIISLSRKIAMSYPQYNFVLAAALHDRVFGFIAKFTPDPDIAEECIDFFRSLEIHDPKHSVRFADALYNFSSCLFIRGQYEKALCVSLEETRVRRRLPNKQHLVTCLINLSRCLGATGKSKAALDAAEDSVRISRRLLEETTAWESESCVVDSLSNLSCWSSFDPRRCEETLEAAREAVSIQRGLFRHYPVNVFNSRLGVLLHNLSVGFSRANKNEEALRTAEEGLRIRCLTCDDGDRILALSRVASCLKAVGKLDEALQTAGGCLNVVNKLVLSGHNYDSDLERMKLQLAEGLFTVSFCLPMKEALQAARESVAIYRKCLVKSRSPVLQTIFVRALLQLSGLLLSREKNDEALGLAVEAVNIGSGLAKDCHSACLYHLSLCQQTAGNRELGMSFAQTCVNLRRELVEEYGTWQFKENLADALFNLSMFFSSPTASDIVREAIRFQRQIGEELVPEVSWRRLADGLQNLAAHTLLTGQIEEALCSASEAVGLARRLAEIDPGGQVSRLVNVLYTYANVLCEHGLYQDGYIAVVEADILRVSVPSESMIAFLEAKASYMSTHARCLVGLGKK
ncbi:DUF2235 domain-containing protein, partial [Favolaschia claudopus]